MSFKKARLRAGKKVVDVVKHMGVSDAAVYQWENGETMPVAGKLQKLADFYGCSVDELLKNELTSEETS